MANAANRTKVLILSHAAVLDVNRALFQNLAQVTGADVRMIVPQTWSGSLIRELRFEPSMGDAPIQVRALPVANSGNGSLFFYKARLAKAFPGWKPDIVFIDEEPWSSCAVQACAEFRASRILFYTKQNLRKKIPVPFQWLEKYVFSVSKEAFAVTKEVEDVLRDWKHYRKPVHELPHSFDPQLFHERAPTERAATRFDISLPIEAFIVAYIGRLTEEKGLKEFQTAIEIVNSRSNGRTVHYLIAGNGPLADELKSWSQTVPNVSVRAAFPHSEVGRVFSAIDLMVLPSRTTKTWKEQFGRVVIESMASGTPVIGSNSGEIPNLIRKTGGGLVFNEGVASALATSIESLLTEQALYARLRTQGLMQAHAGYSHAAVAKILAGYLGLEPSV